jgi:hypothetical protein
LPRNYLFTGPANLIAVPQSFQQAGKPHRCAAVFSAGRQIPSPCRNHFSGPANLIAAPQSFQQASKTITVPQSFQRASVAALQIFQWAGEPHCRATSINLLYQNIFLKAALSLNCASINLLYQNLF